MKARVLVWDRVMPPFGTRFCKFWAEIEIEYHGELFGAGMPHWRVVRYSQPNQLLQAAGRLATEAVSTGPERPAAQRIKFVAEGSSDTPVLWFDTINSVFPTAGMRGFGSMTTKVGTAAKANGFSQGGNVEWMVLDRKCDPPADTMLWIGLGAKSGGTLGIGRAELGMGLVWNVSDGSPCFYEALAAAGGIGLGASTGAVLALFVCKNPLNLVGQSSAGFDYNVALGAKWSNFVKAAAKLEGSWTAINYLKTLTKATGAGKKAAAALRTAGLTKKIAGAEFESLANLAKTLATTSGIDSEGGFTFLDIPVATPGLEISFVYGTQKIDYAELL
jgi:hypothetical protein